MNRKVVTAIFALSAVLAINALAQAQSSTGQQAGLTNPGFEELRGKEASVVLVETMPGWKTTDTHFEIWGTGFKEVVAHEGTQFVELNAYINGTLYQDSTGIQRGSVLEFTFAHRGRSGEDTMKLTITDLGADNSLDGGDDTVLFSKEYTTGKNAWAVYDSTTEQKIKALGNTVRFAYGAISTATGELGEGNLLDAADFGVGVVSEAPPENAMKLDVDGGAFAFGYRTTAEPGFTEFPNTDSPHPGIIRRNRTDGEYFSYAQNTLETEIKAQESSLVHYPAKSEGSGVLCPGQNPGDVAIARFTADKTAVYKFEITTELIEEDPTGAGVTIYVGDQVVDTFYLTEHLDPWTMGFQRVLKEGQTVDIVVDSGVDENWEKDHVLLTAKAWTTSPAIVTNSTEADVVKTQLANPSFEEPRGIENSFVFTNVMPGWRTTDTVFEIWSTGFQGIEAHDGTQFVELNANLDGTLYQHLTGIGQGAVLDFSFAHRGRYGSDIMILSITDLGSDNTIEGDDRVLFVKEYTTGKDAWEVYNSTSEDPILTLGNTVRFAFTAVHGTGDRGPDKTEGNFLDSVNFGVDAGPPTRSFTLEEAKQILIGEWKADLAETETRYGELDLNVRPMVVDGFFLKFSTNNGLEIVAGDATAAFESYKVAGPAGDYDFRLVAMQAENEQTEALRIIDNNLIILKSSNGETPLVLKRHAGVNETPPANAMKLDVAGGPFTFGYRTTAQPGFTEFPNTDSPHPGITRRNITDGDYFSYAQNTRETEFKAQETDLVLYPAKAEGSGALHPGKNPGDVAIARFTAMNDGEYHFKITAELIEENPTGAGVTIYVDDQVVDKKQLIEHLVPWSTSFQRKLTKGQTVDIAVDSGVDENWEKDHVLITAKAWTKSP